MGIAPDNPVACRHNSEIEMLEMFWYGRRHYHEFEPLVKDQDNQQASDIDSWFLPAG